MKRKEKILNADFRFTYACTRKGENPLIFHSEGFHLKP